MAASNQSGESNVLQLLIIITVIVTPKSLINLLEFVNYTKINQSRERVPDYAGL